MIKKKRRNRNRQEGFQDFDVIKNHPEVAYVSPVTSEWVKARTDNQKQYVQRIRDNDIVVAIGCAGSGKTFLAVTCALQYLKEEKVSKIVITRPIVEAGEKLGFLPGDLKEKIDPYLIPIYDSLAALLGVPETETLIAQKVIEVAPLAYMRGRTLENAFVIADEAQNMSLEQMEMLITRLGIGSKMVITGDVTQIDLPKSRESSLLPLKDIIGHIPGVSFQYFTEEDVMRHPVVKEVIKAYTIWKNAREDAKKK